LKRVTVRVLIGGPTITQSSLTGMKSKKRVKTMNLDCLLKTLRPSEAILCGHLQTKRIAMTSNQHPISDGTETSLRLSILLALVHRWRRELNFQNGLEFGLKWQLPNKDRIHQDRISEAEVVDNKQTGSV
jgi:hypothetical protein